METNQKFAKSIMVVILIMSGILYLGILFATPPADISNGKITISKDVNLTEFTAKYKFGKVYLNWKVQSTTDNNLFVVEKSGDGKKYSTLSIEESAISPADEELLYSVIDENPGYVQVNYNLYNVSEKSKVLMGSIEVSCPLQDISGHNANIKFTRYVLASN